MTYDFDDRMFEAFKARISDGEEGAAEAFYAWNDDKAERFDETFEELVADVPDWAIPTSIVRNYEDTREAQDERWSEEAPIYVNTVTEEITGAERIGVHHARDLIPEWTSP